jgi:TonB-linked SusC/RagA family outer membrane protein
MMKAFFSTFLLFAFSLVYAQESATIQGEITEARTGDPLIGVTVLVQGTAKGFVTDYNGQFTYTLKEENVAETILVVSYIGKKTQYIRVGNQRTFSIVMEEEGNELQEIVITSSYGSKKAKEEVVGSVVQLDMQDLNAFESVESVDKLLEGQVAGVYLESSPQLGAPVSINIRGQGTLTALSNNLISSSTQPLIIIDGIVMGEEKGIDNVLFDGAGTLAENFQNPLSRINPNDIASFTVLKDAAAVSLYGADGANGVILITTKSAQNKKLSVGFSSQFGWSTELDRIQFLSGPQYNALLREYSEQAGFPVGELNDSINTDWFNLLNRNGSFTRNNLNLSQKIGNWDVRASFSYLYNAESQRGNDFSSASGSFRVGFRQPRWQADVSIIPNFNLRNSPNVNANFPLPPNIAPIEADTFALLNIPGRGNPLAVIEQNRDESRSFGLLGRANFQYDILKNWNISTAFTLDYTNKEQDRYWSGDNSSGRFNGSFVLDGVTYPMWGRRQLNNRTLNKWFWRAQTYYEKSWGEHNVDVLAGFEINEEVTDLRRQLARGFVNPGPVNPIEAALADDDPETEEDETLARQLRDEDQFERAGVSIYSQFNYNFDKKYFLLVNFRQDQSSSFGADVNTGINAGVGVSWNVSEEPWLKGVRWLDFLRLKASYGSTGNSRVNSLRSRGIYTIDPNGYYLQPSAFPSTGPNPNLSWEKNFKFNTGIELNFLDRFGIVVEYYHDDIRDLIVSRDIPLETGFTSVQINGANMYNQGIELTLQARWIDTDVFRWNSSINLSRNANEVTSLRGIGDDFSSAARARAQRVGFPTSTIWGVPGGFVDPATGRQLFYKDGQVYDAATYVDLFDAADWEPIGDSQPDLFGGFRNRFTFNNRLTLQITGNFAIGHQTLIDDDYVSQYRIVVNRNMTVNTLDHWRQPGDQALYPKVSETNPIVANASTLLYDLSHIQLRNINLSYLLPVKEGWLKLSSFKVFADVSNVYTWYMEPSPPGRNGIREFRYAYPQMRTFTIGLNANW